MRIFLTLPFLAACTHFNTRPPAPPSAGFFVRASAPVSALAIRRADELAGQMLSHSPGLLRKMREEPFAINILPVAQKMTDIPGMESMQGLKTFDGRDWSEVRGAAWRTDLIAPEENLLCQDQDESRANTFVHELAHSIHFYLDNPTFMEIQDALEYAKQSKLYPEGSYALSNEWEYFAVGSEIYFGTTYRWDIVGKNRNRYELEDRDPQLAKIMDRVYAGAEVHPSPSCASPDERKLN